MARQRLQKILARAGLASRRKCEELILEGRVTVDGELVTRPGLTVDPREQEIRCDGVPLKPQKLAYILLYKPRGFVTSARPAAGQRSVLELVQGFSQRLFPVGRLDRDSEGLLLLTNDGELTEKLTHPRHHVPKTYKVTIGGRLTDEQVKDLEAPVRTSSGRMQLHGVKLVRRGRNRSELEVVLLEGRNREIRRVLAAKGVKVRRLIRIGIGALSVESLKSGQYRRLEKEDIDMLRGKP